MTDLPDEILIDRRMHAWRPENWHLLDVFNAGKIAQEALDHD